MHQRNVVQELFRLVLRVKNVIRWPGTIKWPFRVDGAQISVNDPSVLYAIGRREHPAFVENHTAAVHDFVGVIVVVLHGEECVPRELANSSLLTANDARAWIDGLKLLA